VEAPHPSHRGDRHAELLLRRQRQDPPRYYQVNAVNRVVEAVAKGRNRILLVMATGTGKTYTAFQKFKQIIGRGTRIEEDFGKLYFTILDFKKATELFADPDFDGDPVQVYSPKGDDSLEPPEDELPSEAVEDGELGADEGRGASGEGPGAGAAGFEDADDSGESAGKRVKYVVADVPVYIVAERVQYYGKDGKLITESLRDHSRDAIREKFASLDAFLKTWNASDRKRAILKELEEQGVFFEQLAKDVGKDMSPFDLVCHVAFEQPPLTRKERANNVRKRNMMRGSMCSAHVAVAFRDESS
jgi:type I restriction enzyme R subunit